MAEKSVEHKATQHSCSPKRSTQPEKPTKQLPDDRNNKNGGYQAKLSRQKDNSQGGSSGVESADGLGQDSEMIVLKTILNDASDLELSPQKTWSALQHYVYYIYRHVLSIKPCNNSDTLPDIVSKAIVEILNRLMRLDTTQVCLRMISLLREFILIAKNHIDNIQSVNIATYLVTLMAYYSALCSSAGRCAPLVPEFDYLTLGRFNINWIGINKSIFFHHIYQSSNVQAKIPLFQQLHKENNPNLKGLLETYVCFTHDMEALASKWSTLSTQISDASKKRALSDPTMHLLKDWEMYSEHKRIFSSHVWLNRDYKTQSVQDMNELDAHILAWIADKSFIPETSFDSRGCCLCEECLAAEFRHKTMASALTHTYRSEISSKCVISCYVCFESIPLNTLCIHIVNKHNKTSESGKPELPPQKGKDSKVQTTNTLYEGLLEKNAEIKKSLLQLIDGTSSQRNKTLREKNKKESVSTNDVKDKGHKQNNSSRSACTSLPYKQSSSLLIPPSEHLLKSSTDIIIKLADESPRISKDQQALIIEAANSDEDYQLFLEQLKMLSDNRVENARLLQQKIEQAKANSTSTNKNGYMNNEKLLSAALENGLGNKQGNVVGNMEARVVEFLKNSDPEKISPIPARVNDNCAAEACEPKLKQEEENKNVCSESCEHYKDFRKCDCPYCAVFGSAFPPNTPKPSETRDRLRIRLNQRKEKETENAESEAAKAAAKCMADKNGFHCCMKAAKTSNGKGAAPQKVDKAVTTEPLRVPELHRPVPLPGNSKAVQVAVEVKNPAADKPLVSTSIKAVSSHSNNSTPVASGSKPSDQRSSSLTSTSSGSEKVDCRDINDLIHYIEGTKVVDKLALAHRKAAKKAKQKWRKVQDQDKKQLEELEKQKQLEEARLKEEKLKEEEERRKAEVAARRLAERQKKSKKEEKSPPKQNLKKGKKGNKQEHGLKLSANFEGKGKLLEETIPAMVTIKRASEGNNSQATVTITLKGATQDTDKLLLRLVNGGNTCTTVKENIYIPKGKAAKPMNVNRIVDIPKPSKKKDKENFSKSSNVTVSVEKSNSTKKDTLQKKVDTFATHQLQQAYNNNKDVEDLSKVEGGGNIASNAHPRASSKEDISLPMLNLPPGITITKIDGPPSSSNCKYTNSQDTHYAYNQNTNTGVPSKSGVIVVDTEKLIQQSIAASINKRDKKLSKKKRDLKPPSPKAAEPEKPQERSSMITLKNPIFERHQKNKIANKAKLDFPGTQQASIFKGENGMVTIRSPRLHNPFDNGEPVSSYFSDTQPMFSSDYNSPYIPPQQTAYDNTNHKQFSPFNSHYHAHEFLAGLPGIEITKINRSETPEYDPKVIRPPSYAPKRVPVIDVMDNVNTLNFDIDDWYYDGIFNPKEELHEDMDEEEIELENFKRFCQESMPARTHPTISSLAESLRNITFNNGFSYV